MYFALILAMESVCKNSLNHFLHKVSGLGKSEKAMTTMYTKESFPTGILETCPEITYTPNVAASFERLECARVNKAIDSEKQILKHIKSKVNKSNLLDTSKLCK